MTVALLEQLPDTSLLPHPARSGWLSWYNHGGDRGLIRGWNHLLTMVDRVGCSDDWAFLVIAPLPNTRGAGAWVACCGHAPTGLVAEVGLDANLFCRLVAPTGASIRPWQQLGRHSWFYLAHPAETHRPEVFMGILLDWLDTGTIDPAYELRTTAGRGARRG